MGIIEMIHYLSLIFKNICGDFFKYIKKTIQNEKNFKTNIHIMETSHISDDSIIGSYTYIGHNCNITRAKIGRYCSIANNVSIGPSEHPLSDVSTWVQGDKSNYDLLTEKDCIIGNDVWIGADSIIRRGVTIDNSAIIGANSFVNTNIPEFSIAVGSPAKVIKYRLSPENIKLINESHWWDFNLEEAKKIIADLKKRIK